MNGFKRMIIIFVCVFLLMCCSFLIGTKTEECLVRENVFVKKVERTDKPYEQIINEVYTSNVYSDEYDCENFSEDLIARLNESGYEAEYIRGDFCVDGCGCHAWVKLCLYVEATSGDILEPDYYKENYIHNNCL